eukprot:m.27442 g.27442  ORF g.27442 m.27442 type:complete len:234 (-) comp9016_c0_seq1:28-729(-)
MPHRSPAAPAIADSNFPHPSPRLPLPCEHSEKGPAEPWWLLEEPSLVVLSFSSNPWSFFNCSSLELEMSFVEYAVQGTLAVGIGFLLYKLLAPSSATTVPPVKKKKVLPDRDFTLEELKFYNGTNEVPELDNEKAVYLAVNCVVFDVTQGKAFYGPGGPYSCFAGRDATRGLATMEFQTRDEWDDLSGLSAQERQTAQEWEDKFRMKYIIRGRLIKERVAAAETPSPAPAPAQ